MIYWIAIAFAVASLSVLLVTLGRHWKEIRMLDPDSIKEERVRRTRGQLIEQRFQRVKSSKLAPFKAIGKRVVFSGKTVFHRAYIKLVQLDRFYKQAKAPFSRMAPTMKDRVKVLQDEARSLGRDLKWADAERRYLEILSIDNRNVDAYKGLGSIYLKQKLYPQAKETYEFLMKIDKADDGCYASLGEIAEGEKDDATAEAMYRKALEQQPRLAHRHATLANFYLERGDPGKAWPLAKRASDLEPKSAKYLEMSIEAALGLKNREEARRRYDKFRLLSEDRQKLESLKERIEEMA